MSTRISVASPTVAEQEVLAKGWTWFEESEPSEQYLGPETVVPDSIHDVPDDMVSKILYCEASGKPYKLIAQELELYKTLGIPIPRLCPNERHRRRMKQRNPLQLWDRECVQCGVGIRTSYDPKRSEIVCCDSCYLSAIR